MNMSTYDSRPETYRHIQRVQQLIGMVISSLLHRSEIHDQSKLEPPEKDTFDEFTPKLRDCTYGSDEYKTFLAAMRPALEHHYARNRHHPEHFPWFCAVCCCSFSDGQVTVAEGYDMADRRFCPRCTASGSIIWEAELMHKPERGIAGMNLLDVMEMLCDWKAATERHADGDLRRSIQMNAERFHYGPEITRLLMNTAEAFGWIDGLKS